MSFLNAIKEAISATTKVEEKQDATSRTKEFVGEFKDVAKTHPTELSQAATKLYNLETVKDKAIAKEQETAQVRKEEERLVFALESIVDQVGVVAEEILDLEDAIAENTEAIKVTKEVSKDTLDVLGKMSASTALAAARAERARKQAAKQTM